MADATALLAMDSIDPPVDYEPRDALLGSNYSVPLFWLAMLGADCRGVRPYPFGRWLQRL